MLETYFHLKVAQYINMSYWSYSLWISHAL